MSDRWTHDEADAPNSWLIMVHVNPIPEDAEALIVFDDIVSVVDERLADYDVDVSAVYASKVEVVGLDDLDSFDTIADLPST